jgi:hypothetical protein
LKEKFGLCQIQGNAQARNAPLQPLPIQDVFARWHMDILAGLPKTQEGYQYILLLTNSFSHWAEAFPFITLGKILDQFSCYFEQYALKD